MEKEQVKALYNLLLEFPDQYVSQEFITQILPEHYPAKCSVGGTTINRDIARAIEVINSSSPEEYAKIIVCNNKRAYKVANKEDYLLSISTQWKHIVKRIKRAKLMEAKVKLNGTVDLTSSLSAEQVKVLETLLPTLEKLQDEQSR